jgi:serine/threonine-protein kinase RsbW
VWRGRRPGRHPPVDLTDAPERVALCIALPHGPEAPALARRGIVDAVGPTLSARVLEALLLVVSELVANAVRHGRPGIGPGVSLALQADADHLRIEALDGGGRWRRHPDDAVGGWGLALVDALADRWGLTRGRPTVAWAEFDLVSSPRNRTPVARSDRRVR